MPPAHPEKRHMMRGQQGPLVVAGEQPAYIRIMRSSALAQLGQREGVPASASASAAALEALASSILATSASPSSCQPQKRAARPPQAPSFKHTASGPTVRAWHPARCAGQEEAGVQRTSTNGWETESRARQHRAAVGDTRRHAERFAICWRIGRAHRAAVGDFDAL